MSFSPDQFIHSYGYAAVLLAPMVESTGVPFPGETTLILASVYSADTGRLSLPLVIALAAVGAILGDNFGYGVGRWLGRGLLERWGSRVGLDHRRVLLVDRFFARRGALAVFVARFLSVLRTFGAILAGAGRMRYRTYLVFNALGGMAWATAYGLLGFELGRAYSRLSGAIGTAALALAALVVIAFLGALFLFRRPLERWALGDLDELQEGPR
ncbi:MAG: DedA family protein [Candidatus Dormibacteraeota bacterium]|nr:DedA family protein [Candidatus Dormibacteraeota bacterium]